MQHRGAYVWKRNITNGSARLKRQSKKQSKLCGDSKHGLSHMQFDTRVLPNAKTEENGIIIAGPLKFLFKWDSRCLDKAHHEKTRVAICTDELQLTRQKCVRVCVHACMRVCVHACVRVLVRGEVTSDTGHPYFFSAAQYATVNMTVARF